MPIITPEKIRTPAGDDNYALTADMRRMAESINHVVPVANISARTAVVQALEAAGRTPSAADPLIVDREDAPALGHLERTQDGTNWETLWTEVGRTYTAEGGGGGALSTAWTEANVPARLELPAGRYLVVVMLNLTLSAGAIVRIESHLFEGAAGLGVGQQAVDAVETIGSTTSRTQDFTRLVTIAGSPGSLRVQTRTTQVMGTQSRGTQSLTAIRLPG